MTELIVFASELAFQSSAAGSAPAEGINRAADDTAPIRAAAHIPVRNFTGSLLGFYEQDARVRHTR